MLATSVLVIQCPSTINLVGSTCTVSSPNGGITTTPSSCATIYNVSTIIDPFTTSFEKGASAFSFYIHTQMYNP